MKNHFHCRCFNFAKTVRNKWTSGKKLCSCITVAAVKVYGSNGKKNKKEQYNSQSVQPLYTLVFISWKRENNNTLTHTVSDNSVCRVCNKMEWYWMKSKLKFFFFFFRSNEFRAMRIAIVSLSSTELSAQLRCCWFVSDR